MTSVQKNTVAFLLPLILKDGLHLVLAILVWYCVLHYLFGLQLVAKLMLLIPACSFVTLSRVIRIVLQYRLERGGGTLSAGQCESGGHGLWRPWIAYLLYASKGGGLARYWLLVSFLAVVVTVTQALAIAFIVIHERYVLGGILAATSLVAIFAMARPAMGILMARPRFRTLAGDGADARDYRDCLVGNRERQLV